MTEPREDGLPADGLSWVRGDRSKPLFEITIPELLAQRAAARPEDEAAVFSAEGLRWSWSELARRADALAAGLLRLGLGKGDRLGIWAPNRSEWTLAQFATARIGVILVTVNPAYRTSELEYSLKLTGCKALILAERFKKSDYVAMIRELAPELDQGAAELSSPRLPDLRHVILAAAEPRPGMRLFREVEALGAKALAEEGARAELEAATAALDRNDPINIQFTSGTTGLPKGATLTHRNILNNAHFVTAALNLGPEDRVVIPVPFYHCFGMVMGVLGCLTKGATMIIPAEGFDAATTLAAASAEKATALYGVPTMFVAMLEAPDFDRYDFSRMRTGIMAGAPCPIEVMRRIQERMNLREVTIAYGMTETSPVSFQSSTQTPLEKRVASVGRVHPHVEVKIVDLDDRVVPVGEQGELLTRGYSVMQGYWRDPKQTAAAVDPEGWMRTGDLGRIDAEGYCNITGRAKDMICRGGENVYPREIEEFLFTHPEISQAQVFGIPDDRLGEIVCVWIVPRAGAALTEAAVREFCREKIAHYKVPAVVRFREELPATVTGKPQKFLMRRAMIEELGLSEVKSA